MALLERSTRGIGLTPAGELLLRRGGELLAHADDVFEAVRARSAAVTGRLQLGLTPTARYGLGPRLLAACAAVAPAVMLYTSEDTSGALVRDVARGRLDLAVVFCLPEPRPDELASLPPAREARGRAPARWTPAGRARDGFAGRPRRRDHPRWRQAATPPALPIAWSARRRRRATGPHPRGPVSGPRPAGGSRGLGVVVYVRSAFPSQLAGSAFVAIDPPIELPFELVWRAGQAGTALDAVLAVARGL